MHMHDQRSCMTCARMQKGEKCFLSFFYLSFHAQFAYFPSWPCVFSLVCENLDTETTTSYMAIVLDMNNHKPVIYQDSNPQVIEAGNAALEDIPFLPHAARFSRMNTCWRL
jgi:hypothetical protein